MRAISLFYVQWTVAHGVHPQTCDWNVLFLPVLYFCWIFCRLPKGGRESILSEDQETAVLYTVVHVLFYICILGILIGQWLIDGPASLSRSTFQGHMH